MRRLRPFDYFKPETLDEALALARTYAGRARLLAGGTDVLVALKRRRPVPEVLIDLKGLRALEGLTRTEAGDWRIGALVTIDAIARSAQVRASLTLLRTAALAIGHPQVRTRATVVGNVCNGSPSADLPPGLLALEARLRIAREGSERLVPLSEFYAGPFRTVLEPDEIVTAIELPPMGARTAGSYAWMSKLTAVDETLVGAASVVSLAEDGYVRDVRIALGSMGPVPARAWKAEEFLRNRRADVRVFREAAAIAAADTDPRRRAEYRRHMTRVLLERSLTDALKAAS